MRKNSEKYPVIWLDMPEAPDTTVVLKVHYGTYPYRIPLTAEAEATLREALNKRAEETS